MGYDMQWQKDETDEGYFRANIWAMPILRTAMELAGVLDFNTRHPPWPEDDNADLCPVLGFRGLPGKVPVCKFGSNDGWIVHPEEAKIIADGLEKWLSVVHPSRGTDDDIAFVRQWMNYCRKCADENVAFQVW